MTNTKKNIVLILSILTLVSCNNKEIEYNYPKAAQEIKQNRAGSLFNKKLSSNIFGHQNKDVVNNNSYANTPLWKAALETVSFMPLNSVDSNSGVIVTDWYCNPDIGIERFKVTITIKSHDLRVDGVKVNMFRELLEKGKNWVAVETSHHVIREFEDEIIDRARKLKLNQE